MRAIAAGAVRVLQLGTASFLQTFQPRTVKHNPTCKTCAEHRE